jgi:hypothetical protein
MIIRRNQVLTGDKVDETDDSYEIEDTGGTKENIVVCHSCSPFMVFP